MSLHILKRVNLFPQHPIFAAARLVVVGAFDEEGVDCFLTSAYGGQHSPKSKHHSGLAEDYAPTHVQIDLKPGLVKRLADKIRQRLPDDFDVVAEAKHVHVEYDPDRS